MRSPASARESVGWMARGACQGEDPEIFFPVAEAHVFERQVAAAKAVCWRCPVRMTCLSYALATRQDGIWGGTTGHERHTRRNKPGACSGGPSVHSAPPHAAPGRPAR
jgi:WhiB family redox-sensing transcriptional regulator